MGISRAIVLTEKEEREEKGKEDLGKEDSGIMEDTEERGEKETEEENRSTAKEEKAKAREVRDPNLGLVGSVEVRTSRETAHRRAKARGMEEQDR